MTEASPSSSAITFPIEAAHVTMFVRALGDRDARWEDRISSGVVPLTFPTCVAQFDPDNELRPSASRRWFGSASTSGTARPSTSDGTTRLHAEQYFTYSRPLRVGDVLTATRRPGRMWDKTGKRGGTMCFSETITDFVDGDGELVVTSRSVSVKVNRTPSASGGPS